MGDVHHGSGPSVSEMTYTVSNGTLNSTIPYCTYKPTLVKIDAYNFELSW